MDHHSSILILAALMSWSAAMLSTLVQAKMDHLIEANDETRGATLMSCYNFSITSISHNSPWGETRKKDISCRWTLAAIRAIRTRGIKI